MSESDGLNNETTDNGAVKNSKGSYLSDQIISILFPIAAVWYGPKYLINKEYLKGAIILGIFAIELYIIYTVMS